MIKLEIVDSPDLLSIGIAEYSLHHISIGRSLKNTIIVNDEKLLKEHGSFRLSSKRLLFESIHKYHHNDKQISGTVLIKENDLLQLGNTLLKVHNYDSSSLLSNDEYYNYISRLEKEDIDLANLILAIEQEFIYQTSKDINELEE